MPHLLRLRAATRWKRATSDRGFTLIELLVVVVILGVLVAIAIPLYLNYRKGVNDAAAQTDLRNTVSVLEVCFATTGAYPVQQSAVTWSITTPVQPCAGQTVILSNGTSLKYSSTGASYVLLGTSSTGNSKYYCFNSSKGGAVGTVTAPNFAAASC